MNAAIFGCQWFCPVTRCTAATRRSWTTRDLAACGAHRVVALPDVRPVGRHVGREEMRLPFSARPSTLSGSKLLNVNSADHQPALAAGQRWRIEGAQGVDIITVERLDGDTVHGYASPETAPTVTSVWVGSRRDLLDATLVVDPQRETFKVLVQADVYDPNVRRRLQRLGTVESMAASALIDGGARGPIARIWVVADNSDHALERARHAAPEARGLWLGRLDA